MIQAVVNRQSEEIRKAREELFQELDKGIRDMEREDVFVVLKNVSDSVFLSNQ